MTSVRRFGRRALLAGGGSLLVVSCGGASRSGAPTLPGDPDATTASGASAVGAAALTTAPPPVPALPPTTLPPTTLPVPERVPTDPHAPEPDVVLGRIRIERLALDAELREGVTLTTLDKGPGHWPGTAMPGRVGNLVVAGHRVTHSKPFRHIDDLVPGDAVEVTLTSGDSLRYRVTGAEVVGDKALWIVDQTARPTATLFACHPPGSARQRYVVHLALGA